MEEAAPAPAGAGIAAGAAEADAAISPRLDLALGRDCSYVPVDRIVEYVSKSKTTLELLSKCY